MRPDWSARKCRIALSIIFVLLVFHPRACVGPLDGAPAGHAYGMKAGVLAVHVLVFFAGKGFHMQKKPLRVSEDRKRIEGRSGILDRSAAARP